ncbi:MAG: hypothetical protein PHR30_03340 [Gallionellaceae bacterium]|nr:hypothetical protein [Gallionellaceae bacterium]
MKLHQIALAVAALATGSAQAAALNPSLVVYLDGATATKQTVVDVASYMCAGHTGVSYKDSTGKITGVFCSAGMDASSGLATSLKVFMTKNNADGSLETFDRALSRKAQTKVLDDANCDTATKICGTKLVDAHGGFSDVDQNVWIGRGQFNPALVSGGYTVKAGFAGQGFGLAVSTKLYEALQAQQGLIVGAMDDANRPNITSQQYASILSTSGGYKYDWSPILPGVAGSDAKYLNLCRRVTSSGTQASMDAFFLNNPCAHAAPTYGMADSVRAADYPTDNSNGMAVFEAPGTGDVLNCLSRRNKDMNDSATGTPTGSSGALENEWAIGVASLENADGKADSEGVANGWHYVKLDGVSPVEDAGQRQSVVDGRYNFAEEMVLAYRNDAPANVKTYLGKMAGLMGDPSKVAPLTGIFVVPGASSHSAYPNRVHKGTRFGNACSPFALFE